MPEMLDLREPLLVNAVGHSAGVLIFGLLLIVLLRDKRLRLAAGGLLPPFAALLAVLWNAGSLAALAGSISGQWSTALPTAVGFAALSLLPAVLLAIALEGQMPYTQRVGWAISLSAVAMHVMEAFNGDDRFHRSALLLVTLGFAVLPAVAGFRLRRGRRPLRRVLAPMALMLFAISFVHFGDSHSGHPWSAELAFHHAGIPLALYVGLQDYRFLLLDVFLRTLASGLLAGAFILALIWSNQQWRLQEVAFSNPLYAGVAIVIACCVLVTFAWLRGVLQAWVTRRVFRRSNVEDTIQKLVGASTPVQSEEELLKSAAEIVAWFAGTDRFAVADGPIGSGLSLPDLPADSEGARAGDWVDAILPLQFARGDQKAILLGQRMGARRYLSEDLRELSRLAVVVVARVERFRSEAVERLASEAELRALQAQINPHFLFNALNALYGSIPRPAEDARRMVLNLAEIFRYFLHNERSSIPLNQELKIIRAYLEIEQLRLGDRLRTEIDVDEEAGAIAIPPLSIQPLVENAVKHGVASRTGPGYVILRIRRAESVLQVEVRDSGGKFLSADGATLDGVGLKNVRQRLRLTYGLEARLRIRSEAGETVVSFDAPLERSGEAASRLPAVSAR